MSANRKTAGKDRAKKFSEKVNRAIILTKTFGKIRVSFKASCACSLKYKAKAAGLRFQPGWRRAAPSGMPPLCCAEADSADPGTRAADGSPRRPPGGGRQPFGNIRRPGKASPKPPQTPCSPKKNPIFFCPPFALHYLCTQLKVLVRICKTSVT